MATDDPARDAWGVVCELLFSRELHDRMHRANDALGLTPPLCKALMHLDEATAKPMRRLADEWGCDASYVTSIVDALEERGFAERRLLPTDRRVRAVGLTPHGHKAQQVWLAKVHEPPSCFSALSAQEQRTLRDLLRKVADAASIHMPS